MATFAHPQDMLGATRIDAQGDQDRVVVVGDAIDHHHLEIQVAAWADG